MTNTKDDEDHWREKLGDARYHVCRLGGTEPPFSGAYYDLKDEGTYDCACCAAPLFTSDSKYDSGSGWPSFFMPVHKKAITEILDRSHGMVRMEIRCASCAAHLGHVFPDGPAPTGLRYCVNSLSLQFTPKG